MMWVKSFAVQDYDDGDDANGYFGFGIPGKLYGE